MENIWRGFVRQLKNELSCLFGIPLEAAPEAAPQALNKTPDVCNGDVKKIPEAVNADSLEKVSAHLSDKTDNRQACFV